MPLRPPLLRLLLLAPLRTALGTTSPSPPAPPPWHEGSNCPQGSGLDLLGTTVSPSNLGNKGPDNAAGEAAEVRYHDASTDIDGRSLDFVITTQSSTYDPKNALGGNGLGFYPTAGTKKTPTPTPGPGPTRTPTPDQAGRQSTVATWAP